jgi:hypothetical protein
MGVKQIERRHVECSRHADARAAIREPRGEVEASLTVIETAVDVSARDIDEAFGTGEVGHAKENLHREPCCIPFIAGEQSAIVLREFDFRLVQS